MTTSSNPPHPKGIESLIRADHVETFHARLGDEAAGVEETVLHRSEEDTPPQSAQSRFKLVESFRSVRVIRKFGDQRWIEPRQELASRSQLVVAFSENKNL